MASVQLSSVTSGPSVHSLWGAAFLGLLAACILYGVTLLQVYIYFSNYPNDPRKFKLLAIVVWILDTASLGLVITAMYGYLITDMNNPFNRIRVNRTLDLDPTIMGVLAFLTHWYLGTRVWIVCNRSLLIALLLASMSIASLTLALTSSILSFKLDLWSQRTSLRSLALSGTVLVVALDCLIASILCIYLVKQRTTGKRARRLVKRIIIFAINTGLASSALSIVNVVTFIALPDTMIFLGTNFMFTKIYSNSLLANLNARESLRGKGYEHDGALSLNLSALRDGATISVIQYSDPFAPQTHGAEPDDLPKASKDHPQSHVVV